MWLVSAGSRLHILPQRHNKNIFLGLKLRTNLTKFYCLPIMTTVSKYILHGSATANYQVLCKVGYGVVAVEMGKGYYF